MAAHSATRVFERWFDKEPESGRTPLPGAVITVSGPHGTGKSTYAKALAEALNLRYVSAGELFRNLAKQQNLSLEDFSHRAADDPSIDQMLDERTKAEAKKGGVVIDAQLGAWMVRDLADAKVLLTAPDAVRFKRIAERDRRAMADAMRETENRESIQKQRYRKYYGIDVTDLSIYDLKIDTSLYTIEKTKALIVDAVSNFLVRRGKLKASAS
ncbi:MAG TPA: AAA family ATPase [Candidatus Acidoferrales bacterium]|nr:AAA family ATPase [Candidatus Acidoferrales bacterium]